MAETQVKPENQAPVVNEDKLAASIAAGIAKALPEAMRATQPERAEVVPPRPVPLSPIEDVREEEVLDAIEAGDKTKAAGLMRKQRAADRERMRREELSPILTNGGAALASVAKQLANNLPHYKRFKKEIDARIADWQAANPGAIPTFEHYKFAHDAIRGEHYDELAAEAREEAIRQAREPDPALVPDNQRHIDNTPKKPTTLQEALAGDWKTEFAQKSRAVGGRGDDEEMKRAGFGSVAGFLAKREELAQLEATLDSDSLGLDRDWDPKEKHWLTFEESKRLGI